MSGDITLLRPIWLLAVPVLLAFGVWFWRRQRHLGDWEQATDPRLLAAMAALGRVEPGRRNGSELFVLAGAVIVVLALAGPALERRDAVSFRNLDGVMVVVDASPSVLEDPRWPQLLTTAQFAIAGLGSRPAGLIVFAGDAYLATEMTHDPVHVAQMLTLLEPGLVPDPGSRPARALDMALRALQDAEILAGDVVVFGDGQGLDATSLATTARLAGQGARVSFVAWEASAQIATHAEIGQGRVFTPDQAEALSDWMRQSARPQREQLAYPLLFWNDLGRYVLVLALIPVLGLFRRSVT